MTAITKIAAGLQLPAELIEHQRALDDALTTARRTRQAVDETAAQIPELESELRELTAKLAEKDADRAVAQDRDVKGLDAELKRLTGEQDSKERALNRARAALVVHERRAPEQDGEVQAAVIVLENDLLLFGASLVQQLLPHLAEAAKPLAGLFAALRVLSPIGGLNLREAIAAAYVPADPLAFVSLQGHMIGANLLDEAPAGEHAALAEALSNALAPIRASIAAGKALSPYLALDKRPRPYVRKGYSYDGEATRAARAREAAPAAAEASAAREPSAQAERPASGFKRKHHSDGRPIVDGSIGAQLVDNMMSDRGGSEFAVG